MQPDESSTPDWLGGSPRDVESALRHIIPSAIASAAAGRVFAPPADFIQALEFPAGLFVTIRRGDELRGCIGRYYDPLTTLSAISAEMAAAAALRDPRFPPVGEDELTSLTCSATVLGPSISIQTPSDIVIGRDGVVVEFGRLRGTLLPEVAVEYGWDAHEFLRQTSLKAGGTSDIWWQDGARLWRYEGLSFKLGAVAQAP